MELKLYQKMLLTGLAAVLFFLINAVFSRLISKQETLETYKRRKILVRVRDVLSALFLVANILIWHSQLRTIATTLAVIAVAIVIATKEYILNITGFLFRSTAHVFTIGDRIDTGDIRGDVIDQTLVGVWILEIGPGTNQYTGRTVFIPNSLFLSISVKNETRMMRDYVFHLITFPLRADDDWETYENILLEIANQIVAPYEKEIRENLKILARRHGLDAPAFEPRIYIQMPDPEKINLMLRMPVPIQRRGRVEQQVIREFLSRKQVLIESTKSEKKTST